ncbi:carboxypeptidase-like regulatory domain-containing protein [Cellulomonas dongxiuzhuiae]|uniref:alpha-amylase n=1 Tax=Cellulomonas dongxiuzhuiae TaxID=2819979 RepID=A0ABX8GI66_9CELL|nr:carboxypeptidase-like regulatory domain-containing protein [Cellulomonas dongxiuzhuiae]MBO3094611.1 carboxypeptidase regulatory-like domain-containing protein [Cellulomonas dongxiuzhuiae]QWC15625.1 carboxypeptidase-like regulatory domain-containing protein [Cellulomonas dongxiuzhuiae]
MRAVSAPSALEVAPGGTGTVPLEVQNTSGVIDELTVQVLGVPPDAVDASPSRVVLFPDATAHVQLTFRLPETFPAGTHVLSVVLTGRAGGAAPAPLPVELTVPARPAARLGAAPTLARARRRAAYTVQATNTGNVPLDLALRTVDTDRALTVTLTPSTLHVPVAGATSSTVVVHAPRRLLGSDQDRAVRVEAVGVGDDAATGGVLLTLRHRPLVGRGAVTALVLLAILAAWAAAMWFGMRMALGAEPVGKVAAGSFYAATVGAGAAPDGALAKDGAVAAAVGATLTGTVTSAVDGQGVGRLTVDALRRSRDGLVVVSSAATQADGTYTMSGLFPGAYLVRVQAEGYTTLWYPASPDETAARAVQAPAQKTTEGVDLRVEGDPASLTGTVDVGQTTREVTVDVTATAAWDGADPTLTWTTTTQGGTYLFEGLPAPGTYALTFTAEGYAPTTTTERVLGGQERIATAVTLGAGTGQVAGVVTDGVNRLGGVTVTTTVDGEEVQVGTPTVGDVGRFVLPALPTPATYVLTFTRAGYGTQTLVVDLGAGEQRDDVRAALPAGAGTVRGRVVDPTGAGLGGVQVAAGGAAGATTTLTAGDVGAFTLAGVGAGELTLTFTKPGYTSTTVAVDAAGGTAGTVTLRPAVGTVTGRVLRGSTGVAGLTVRATDGAEVRTTTSAQSGALGAGTYALEGLHAGRWTVSVLDADGRVLATTLVTVGGGASARTDLTVPGS